MARNKTPGNIPYAQLQELIDAHDGISSQELSEIIFGDTDRDHVTSVLHCCTSGMKNHSLHIVKRRANRSIHVVWYPMKYLGVPVTDLEKLMVKMEEFTVRELADVYHEGNIKRAYYSKMEKYVELMEMDESVEFVGKNENGKDVFRWIDYGREAQD